jgi:hypothetical protein
MGTPGTPVGEAMKLDIQKLLRLIHRNAVGNREHRGIHVHSELRNEGSAEGIEVLVEFPDLSWKAKCTTSGVLTSDGAVTREYLWCDILLEEFDLPFELIGQTLYSHADKMMVASFQSRGSWSSMCAPGLFILWIFSEVHKMQVQNVKKQ